MTPDICLMKIYHKYSFALFGMPGSREGGAGCSRKFVFPPPSPPIFSSQLYIVRVSGIFNTKEINTMSHTWKIIQGLLETQHTFKQIILNFSCKNIVENNN